MIVAQDIGILRPQVRTDIVFGPPGLSGETTVYYIKDKTTNWFYRVGTKEHFLISRMDGQSTLQEIGEQYAQKFGHRLNNQSWQNLFTLLEKRQLLVSSASSAGLAELKQEAERRKRAENRKLFRRRFKLVNPDAFLGRVLPAFRFAFHPAFVISILLAVVALELGVALNIQAIGNSIWSSYQHPFVFIVFIALIWLFTAAHEIAHGLTCKRFGGSVLEIGLLWRYLSFFPYCKVDDVVLFHNRWHRVYTAFAGTFANFVLLLPFGALWWLVPGNSALKELSALFLIIFNLETFINFIPFIELDGYFMLSHALDLVDLRKESHRFWLHIVRKVVLRNEQSSRHYSTRGRWLYGSYGLFSLSATTFFLGAICFYWFTTLRAYLGPVVSWGVFVAIVLFLSCRWIVQQRRGKALPK